MTKLINIDNGGTLTDFCVIEGEQTWRSKTVTTPHDLSKCFFDGLNKISAQIYGTPSIDRLLRDAECIRYSTTQGTNALVERKGVRLGLLTNDVALTKKLAADERQQALLQDLVGDRVQIVAQGGDGTFATAALVSGINALGAAGANRIVIGFTGDSAAAQEDEAYRTILRSFPSHLLGALPALCSSHLSEERDPAIRVWTTLFNAFLHPSMERFLYSANRRLRETRAKAPLLIFRNDGGAASVAKTVAVRTYSSGPRGGLEGVKAIADYYRWPDVISFDVGGTTTDIGRVRDGMVQTNRYGKIEGVVVDLALSDVVSHGVGGGSIIRADGDLIAVGPQSVGAAPGPACFAFGGTEATITDTYLLMGLLDPSTYFGGDLRLDAERAKAAIIDKVATPLKLDIDAALSAMERAWVQKIATAIGEMGGIDSATTLAAFGGAGGLAATAIADSLGVRSITIPALASVFSAYGIGFSDVSHSFERVLSKHSVEELLKQRDLMMRRAESDMFGEGVALQECSLDWRLEILRNDTVVEHGLDWEREMIFDFRDCKWARLKLTTSKSMPRPRFGVVKDVKAHDAEISGRRSVLIDGQRRDLPLVRLDRQRPGAQASGPIVLEDDYLTAKVNKNWRFSLTASRDIHLLRD